MSIFTFTPLDDPQAGIGAFAGTLTYGINASGQAVGYYTDSGGRDHGFLLNGGSYTNFDDPDAGNSGQTVAQGINNLGQIAGYYINGPQELGFVKPAIAIPSSSTRTTSTTSRLHTESTARARSSENTRMRPVPMALSILRA
jgi:probable HAF family extracellular repeat protein